SGDCPPNCQVAQLDCEVELDTGRVPVIEVVEMASTGNLFRRSLHRSLPNLDGETSPRAHAVLLPSCASPVSLCPRTGSPPRAAGTGWVRSTVRGGPAPRRAAPASPGAPTPRRRGHQLPR